MLKSAEVKVCAAALTRALRASRAPRGSWWQSHHRAVPFGRTMLEGCVQEWGAVLEGFLAGGSAEVSPTGLPSSKIPKPGQNTPLTGGGKRDGGGVLN